MNTITVCCFIDTDTYFSGIEVTEIDVAHFSQVFHTALRYIFGKLQF